MKGTIHIKENSKIIVRWENGDNLLTGKPYLWEAELLDQDSIDRGKLKIGQEVEFVVTNNFKVTIIHNN